MKISQKGFISPLLLALIAILLLGGGAYVYVHNKPVKQSEMVSSTIATSTTQTSDVQTAGWKTYQNQKLGFKFKYPSQYAVDESTSNLDDPHWKSMTFLSIYDPKDTSTYEFHVIPVKIILERQPLVYQGMVYHTIDDLVQKSGQFSTSPNTDMVSINGERAWHYTSPQGDAEDAPVEEYKFMKNDIVIEIVLNANDQYHTALIQGFDFQ